jgi:FtsP/CotA-like multicopper oxidase with cupredoxin domain
MATHKDEASCSSDSFDYLEMLEREEDLVGEQEERLLAGHGIQHKTKWHLRTREVFTGSILAILLVVSGLAMMRTFVDEHNSHTENLDTINVGEFRRPGSDYLLDPNWNFQASSTVREYNWKIVDIIGNPDGVFRPMLTINGQFPGPMIECNEGDTIVIDVDNKSANATSLHFHGIFQNGTNWMDGTTGITQCPIAPGYKFRYEFTVTGQSGTYYYHGHQAVQASDGLYGPLVIHSRDEEKVHQISYATDRVVMLQDYYHDLSSGLLISALEPGSESSPIPNGALINGMNKRDCSSLRHRLCSNATASIPFFDLAANERHRLRFINVGTYAWFQVTVDEHEFALTEIDGTDILPAYETNLMIGPAQRYSIILSADQSTGDSFWLRAKMVTHCWKDINLPGEGADEVKAIVQYTSKGHDMDGEGLVAQPSSSNWNQHMEVQCKDMNTTSYVPISYEPAPAIAHHSYYLRSNLEIGDWRLKRGFFNTSTFRPDLQNPTLHRTVKGLATRNESFTSMSASDGVNSVSYDLKNDFVIQHSGIKVVDVIVQNFDEENHPIHLHGHKFWVLGQGHGMFPGYESLGLKPQGQGPLDDQDGRLDNLIRRDVATTEGFGWLALRFVADNPGLWALHCHMAWHSEAGLLMQFLSRVDEVAKWTIPEPNLQLCDAEVQELEKGACPKDSIWFGFGTGG